MTLLLCAIDCGACTVEMLPGRTGEAGLNNVCTLSMELLLVLDQQARKLPRTDRHSHGLQEVQDFRLAHPICVVQSQDPCSHFRSKLACVACRKISQIRPLLAG